MDSASRKTQREALKAQFYSEFDRSKAELWASFSDKELEAKGQLLGRGTHFSAYRFGGLVFKRAHEGTFAKGALTLRGWLAALEKAGGVGDLMPPFELLPIEASPSLVMPYGGQPLAAAGKAWQPLDERLKAFGAQLAAKGLVLDDVVQGRCRDGVPFIVDLSDLRLI